MLDSYNELVESQVNILKIIHENKTRAISAIILSRTNRFTTGKTVKYSQYSTGKPELVVHSQECLVNFRIAISVFISNQKV